jgi:ESCRT-II complex subunit VPS25
MLVKSHPPLNLYMETSAEFKFPEIYEFRPFFTPQVNEQTRQAQFKYWDSLILSYCRHYRIFTLDLTRVNSQGQQTRGAIDGELFCNAKIQRSLNVDAIRTIFDHMVKEGHMEWLSKDSVLVYWKRPEEWATEIRNWVRDSGQNGTVMTLYELTDGDLAQNQEFAGLDETLLRKSVNILVGRNEAVLMKASDGTVAGIKVL